MTFEAYFVEQLISRGMWPDQAAEVMAAAKSDKCLASMAQLWQKNIEAYPEHVCVTSWLAIREHALAWIDANVPGAFYRAAFVA